MSQKLEGAPSKMRLERANPGPNVAYPVDNQLNACADNNHSLSHVGSFLDCLTLILVGGKVNWRGRLMMWHKRKQALGPFCSQLPESSFAQTWVRIPIALAARLRLSRL